MKRYLQVLLVGLLILVLFTNCARAEFEVSPITVAPSEVVAGETITVNTDVTNVGGAGGTYIATLIVDGSEISTKEMDVAAGATETLSLTCVVKTPGSHTLELNGLSTTVTALKPAEFEVSELVVTPSALETDKQAVATAEVTNVGDVDGIYLARLNVGGEVVDIKEVSIGTGSSETISFTFSLEKVGTHPVTLGNAASTVEIWPDAKEIARLTQESWKDVKTYQMEGMLTMNMSAKSEEKVDEVNISMDYDLTVDYDAEKMKQVIKMIMESTDVGKEEGIIEMYLIGDKAYVLVKAPGEPTDWQKETIGPEMWENLQLPEQQVDILETADVELLSTEEMGGVNCYALKVSTSGDEMWEMMLGTMAAGAGEEISPSDMEIMQGLGQLLGSADISASQWVTKDDYFLKKAEMTMDWSILGIMSIEMSLDLSVSNYNEPVLIELPPEAEA